MHLFASSAARPLHGSDEEEAIPAASELARLEDNSCDLAQGYGIAKPMPLDEFLQWVHTFNQTRQQLET